MFTTTDQQGKPDSFQIPSTPEIGYVDTFEEASMDNLLTLAEAEAQSDLARVPGVERVAEVAHEVYSSDDQIRLGDDDEFGPNALLDANAALIDAQRAAQATDTERLATKIESPELIWENIGKYGDIIVTTRGNLIAKQHEDPESVDALRMRAN